FHGSELRSYHSHLRAHSSSCSRVGGAQCSTPWMMLYLEPEGAPRAASDQKANLSRGCRRSSTRRVTAGAAYQVPTTNRITGPKLHAAGAPRKCSPAIDDSSPGRRRGYPAAVSSCAVSSGARNG